MPGSIERSPRSPVRRGVSAAFLPLFLTLTVAVSWTQELPASTAARLSAEKAVLSFALRPDALALLPGFPGNAVFRKRHAALEPHFSQEGLFVLPGDKGSVTVDSARLLLSAVPSLSELSAADERTGRPVRLFTEASLVGEPEEREGTLSFVIRTADVDFGTARFQVTVVPVGFPVADRVEMRMVNLDPLHFLIFPSVAPGKALVDLVYFPRERESVLYLAWSVRAVISVPGFIPVEEPLRRRALALKDWYIRQLENMAK